MTTQEALEHLRQIREACVMPLAMGEQQIEAYCAGIGRMINVEALDLAIAALLEETMTTLAVAAVSQKENTE